MNKIAIALFAIIVLFAHSVGLAQQANISPQQRVANALTSSSIRVVEGNLKLIPDGTAGREKVIAHLSELRKREALTSGDIRTVEDDLKLIPEGTAGREQIVARLGSLRKKQAGKNAADAIVARRGYAKILREKFLDNGTDIKVSVSGKSADQLNLKFALFNDVWVHKFRKGTLMNEVAAVGFNRVDFNDGYDYHVVLTFK